MDQADGSGWISLLCLNLMRIALTLRKKTPFMKGLGSNFSNTLFMSQRRCAKAIGATYDMWNEKDGFFYSHFRYPDGHTEEIPIRSLVGIIPFFACDVWDEEELKQFPEFYDCLSMDDAEREPS